MFVAASSVRENFVDIDVSVTAGVVRGVLILVLLGIALYRHREAHEPTARDALLESGFWVLCGILFGVGVAVVWGGEAFGEYISGYLIE